MFTSITDTDMDEHPPKSSPPWVWVGFLFVFAFFVIEVLFVVLGLDEAGINLILTLIAIGGWIYWMVCIYQIHKILAQMTRNRYPISPGEAAGRHIIPFFNLYWIFKWPGELSEYLNRRGRVKIISGGLIGTMLLLALLLRFFDGAIGMAILFGVTMYVSAKVKRHVKAVRGLSPADLPPLPDPNMFNRPVETATSPAQGAADPPMSRSTS